MDKDFIEIGPDTPDVESKCYGLVKMITLAASAAARGPVEAMMRAGTVAAGALHPLAGMINNRRDIDTPKPDEILFAAILVAVCNSETSKEGGVTMYDITLLTEAYDTFARATGRSPDAFLNPMMVKAVAESRNMGIDVLAEFQRKRAEAKAKNERGGATLN